MTLLVVAGLGHLIQKALDLVPGRYPGKHLAHRDRQPQRPLDIPGLQKVLTQQLSRTGPGTVSQ
jgi:hypothetical protein